MTALAAFLVFATARGVYLSPDAGVHVRRIATVPAGSVIDDVAWLGRRDIWYVRWTIRTVRARLYRSSDGGRTWRSVEVASHGAHGGAQDTIQFLDARNGWLTVQEPTAPFATLYATHDGGATWHDAGGLPEVAPVTFQTRTIAWLTGNRYWPAYVYRSVDAGRHWVRLHLPKAMYGTPVFRGGLALLPELRGRTFVVRVGNRVSPPLRVPAVNGPNCRSPALSLAAASRSEWWTAAGRWVYRTRDAGVHWTRIRAPGRSGACDEPTLTSAGGVLLYAVGRAQFASRDGVHWNRLPG